MLAVRRVPAERTTTMEEKETRCPDSKPLTFGSLFAGIGGFDLGFERAGMVCKWQVEIDPFCRKVLAKHWPNVARPVPSPLFRGSRDGIPYWVDRVGACGNAVVPQIAEWIGRRIVASAGRETRSRE